MIDTGVVRLTGHIAFFSFPVYSHIAPTLPVVTGLVERGHRVTYVVADHHAAAVARTGAEVLAYESAVRWEDGLPSGQTQQGMKQTVFSFVREGLAPLEKALAHFADDVPDLFVHDLAASETARILAKHWDRPIAQSCPNLASSDTFSLNESQAEQPHAHIEVSDPEVLEFFAAQTRLIEELGLAEVDIEGFGGNSAPNLVFLPRQFQVNGEQFPERFGFVGPCAAPTSSPEWSPPQGKDQVALVSLGTSHSPDRVEFLARCVEALADTPWHVVITLGDRLDAEVLGELPENVEVHRWLPNSSVLRHASVFVTHCGIGSVMESLSAGVPMMCVPHHADQVVAAEQVVRLGLGRMVDRSRAGAETIRAEISEVASDARYRNSAETMRDHIAQAGGVPRAVELVESWLAA